MKFDKSRVFTCKDAEKAVLGSYGYFANNIGDLKLRVKEENKGCLVSFLFRQASE